MISRSGVVISITDCYIRFTLLYFTKYKWVSKIISEVQISSSRDAPLRKYLKVWEIKYFDGNKIEIPHVRNASSIRMKLPQLSPASSFFRHWKSHCVVQLGYAAILLSFAYSFRFRH